ncbi:hypothetical protein B0T20DRAFT_243556 [Sordaria brevicollis]|uniref:Uncharacterized protein n=1 Tax=Sordaria brevicollis TaxID=83679 RepID=A0AAE0PBD4_SORBR|nr:hypothetical protein B0T20DRAFT_243556 [Sordaria brevicollis]
MLVHIPSPEVLERLWTTDQSIFGFSTTCTESHVGEFNFRHDYLVDGYQNLFSFDVRPDLSSTKRANGQGHFQGGGDLRRPLPTGRMLSGTINHEPEHLNACQQHPERMAGCPRRMTICRRKRGPFILYVSAQTSLQGLTFLAVILIQNFITTNT